VHHGHDLDPAAPGVGEQGRQRQQAHLRDIIAHNIGGSSREPGIPAAARVAWW